MRLLNCILLFGFCLAAIHTTVRGDLFDDDEDYDDDDDDDNTDSDGLSDDGDTTDASIPSNQTETTTVISVLTNEKKLIAGRCTLWGKNAVCENHYYGNDDDSRILDETLKNVDDPTHKETCQRLCVQQTAMGQEAWGCCFQDSVKGCQWNLGIKVYNGESGPIPVYDSNGYPFKRQAMKCSPVHYTSTGSAPVGYINLDPSFRNRFITDDFFVNELGANQTGYRCYSSAILGALPIIINDYDQVVEFCNANDRCFGFQNAGCNKLGPFEVCDEWFAPVEFSGMCVIAKTYGPADFIIQELGKEKKEGKKSDGHPCVEDCEEE